MERLQAMEQQLLQDHLRQMEQHRTKGEHDGRRNLPAVADETIPPQERQVIAVYQSKADEVNGLVRQLLYDVKYSKWQPAVTELLQWSQPWVDQQIGQATQLRDRRLSESAENHFDRLKVLENAPSYSRAKSDLEAAENRLNTVAGRLGRYEMHHKIAPFWAVAIAVAIGLLEIPLNLQTFFVFRDSVLMTLLFCLSLVVIMPILAHITGRFFRQGSERRSYYFIASAMSLAVIVFSFFAGQLRTERIENAPEVSSPFFITINILFFIAAAMASFLAHDPSVSLSDAHRGVSRERRRHAGTLAHFEAEIRKETDRYQQEKEEIQREFSRAESEAQNRQSALQQKVHEATALYNQILSIGQGLERAQQTQSHAIILSRREENLKFRTNHAQPKSWSMALPGLSLSLQEVPEMTWPLVTV
ncbi:MAG: hypothetical protein IT262_06650 [Saprospiraceae bacterium]|nr:hypothetical protein [Saprospiraceae bacterium]